MAEAFVNKATGEVVVAVRKGWKWGKKEQGPDANPAFCIIELNDSDIDKFLEKYKCVVLPYRVIAEVKEGENEPPLEHKYTVPVSLRDGEIPVHKVHMVLNSKVALLAKTLITQGG